MGPWILWLLAESRSTPSFLGWILYFPYAWMASTWNKAPGFFARMASAASWIGWTAPISLFTYIMETKIVSGVMDSRSCSKEISPSLSTSSHVTEKPCSSKNRIGADTAGCSIFVVTKCIPARLFAMAAPSMARLLDSVPPEVNTNSVSFAFNVLQIFFLASRICFSPSIPFPCREEGFP